jgi:lipopolysaccharide biosynthesis glycosyltransferase
MQKWAVIGEMTAMPGSEIEVWFAIDERTTECGFVAAYSLLYHRPVTSRTSIKVAFEKGEVAPAEWWEPMLKKTGANFTFEQVEIDLKDFASCKGVFDSRAAFLRILIPDYSEAKTCLYTDADVVFQEDIGNLLRECKLGGNPIALVRSGICSMQPEKERILLGQCGKADGDSYYYSGLAIINNQEYREQRIIESSIALSKSHAHELSFHDQTVWNCILNNPETIQPRWCHEAYPVKSETKCFHEGIVHFVGSPKPWDLFGEFFHPYAQIWYQAAKRAGLLFPKTRRYGQKDSWKRALRIRRQYAPWLKK